jgi:anti-sigma regulatory factor (Ser/Thr protein kinase)
MGSPSVQPGHLKILAFCPWHCCQKQPYAGGLLEHATPCQALPSTTDENGNSQVDDQRTVEMEPSASPDAWASVPASHHGHNLQRWTLRTTITLGALDGAVPSARAHVRQLLWEWNHAELGEDVGLVASELVTNAVRASAGLGPAIAPLRLWLGSDTHRVLLAVADTSPRSPVRLNLPPDAEGGRGLALVEALSSRWGWHPTTMASLVKVVWAEWCG